jgi:hypothetical protein
MKRELIALTACLALLSGCEARLAVESKPTEVEKSDPPKFKFFVVCTRGGYAEATPNAAGYRLHSIQAHSDATGRISRQWVTLIYELEAPR